MSSLALRLVTILSVMALVVSCARNPVTGEREFTLISESQEIELGQQADQDISQSMGLYEDEAWQEYVDELGQRMAADSERPDLPWTFRVLDDPTVNAFALPGGYIYLTRGILAHFSSEAEMAGVLGHEIGHVTARHGVQQVSRAQLAELGLGIGTVLAPELQAFEDVAAAGLGLLFLSYGRDAERQADDLGLKYMTAEGYDPREMAATFEMLAAASGAADGERLPGWLSTHPDPMERRDRILEEVEEGRVEVGDRVEREAYVQRLDGMPFGQDPREGFFDDGVFHHPEMTFRMTFPEGWQTVNRPDAVQGMHPDQDAIVILTLEDADSPEQAREGFIGQEGVQERARRSESVGRLSAVWADFDVVADDGGDLRGSAVFIQHDGRVFRAMGYAVAQNWDARQSAVMASLESFREETDPDVLAADPARMEVVRTQEDFTLEAFNDAYPSTVDLSTLGTINRVAEGETIPAGTLMKRVTGGAPH